MANIEVHDNIIPEDLYQGLMEASANIQWSFGWNTPANPSHKYWHYEIGIGDKHNTLDISHNVRNHPNPVWAQYMDWLLEHVSPQAKVLRYYLNAHTYGTDGWQHTDTDRKGELTGVLYLTDEWKIEWVGETVIFDEHGDIEKAVLPKRNRLLTFPSDRLHAPRPLSKEFEGLRVVLVVKLAP